MAYSKSFFDKKRYGTEEAEWFDSVIRTQSTSGSFALGTLLRKAVIDETISGWKKASFVSPISRKRRKAVSTVESCEPLWLYKFGLVTLEG